MALRSLRVLHRWIGLVVAVPLAVQGLTGALLTLEPWLGEPAPVVQPGPSQPASAIVATARMAVGPEGRVLRYTPAEPEHAAQVQVAGAHGSPYVLLIDPVDLDLIGDQGDGAWAWLRSLHVQFLAPAYGGRSIVGWFGLGLVLLLVSGIPIWWPGPGGWHAAFTIARTARGVRFHRRLHGAVGIWTAAVLLTMGITGSALAFPRTVRALLGLEGGGPPRAIRVPGGTAGAEPDLDRVLALAQTAAPQARVRVVMLPSMPGEAVRVFLQHAGTEGAAGSVAVQVDGAGQRILAVQDARAQPPADRAWRWMHDLHEGLALGTPWRLLAALAGLSLPLFAVTGPLMWWLRRRNRRRLDTARQAAPQTGTWQVNTQQAGTQQATTRQVSTQKTGP